MYWKTAFLLCLAAPSLLKATWVNVDTSHARVNPDQTYTISVSGYSDYGSSVDMTLYRDGIYCASGQDFFTVDFTDGGLQTIGYHADGYDGWGSATGSTSVRVIGYPPQALELLVTPAHPGEAATLRARTYDPDGNVARVLFWYTTEAEGWWHHIQTVEIGGWENMTELSWTPPTGQGGVALHIGVEDHEGLSHGESNTWVVVNCPILPPRVRPTVSIWADTYSLVSGQSTVVYVRSQDPDGDAEWVNLDVTSPVNGFFGSGQYSVNALAPDNNGLHQVGPTGDHTRSLSVLFPQPGTYVFRGASGDPQGTSYSGSITVSVSDGQAPSVPGGLSAYSITSTSFTLMWNASTDDVGVAAYEVRMGSTSLGEVSGTSKSVTGLSPSTSYSMSVRARDAAGNWSAWSSALPVTTSAPPATFSLEIHRPAE